MTDREKLLELLDAFSTPVTLNGEKLIDWTIPMAALRKALADYLLAKGVIFAKDTNVPSKWIPVSERLPAAHEKVVCLGPEGGVFIAETRYLAGRVLWNDLARIGRRKATHWMPLPKPPQKERNDENES